jgi:maleamate amidohydrolase
MQFTLKPEEAATLVVDMQRLFTQPDSPFQNDAADLFDPINRLTELSRSAGIPVVFSSLEFADDGHDAGLISNWPQVQEGYFAKSNPWTDWDSRLVIETSDHKLSRNRPSAFVDGELDALLKRLGKTQLIFTGISTNFAVAFTVHDAFTRDIPTFMERDGIAPAPFEDSGNEYVFLQTLDTWAGQVVTLDDIVDGTTSKQTATI